MTSFVTVGQARLAYEKVEGRGPGILFLHGFRSDKNGAKALALDDWCQRHGRAYVRFDYRGHGESTGDFKDFTLSDWIDDACAALDQLTDGPQIIVGSSMSGWIMLHLALRRPERVAGLIGLAAAPDFTRDLQEHPTLIQNRAALERDGIMYCPCDYGAPYPITQALLEDGRKYLLLTSGAPVPIACPVRLIQGMKDTDVPWQKSLRLAEALQASDVRVTLIKDGDHRLSRPTDINVLVAALEELSIRYS